MHSKPIELTALRKADINFSVPFEIKMDDNPHTLHCLEILRIVPGKRVVAFANWNGKTVVAKLFYGTKQYTHCEREVTGISVLIKEGIPTPALLARETAMGGNIQILIFEKLQDAIGLDVIWRNKPADAKLFRLLQILTMELATQHVLGVLQKDLHLKNFMLANKKIYTIDGGSIVGFNHPLSKRKSLRNLGLFFSELGVGTDELQNKLFDTYIKARSWFVKSKDKQFLNKVIKEHNRERWQKFEKKMERSSTGFARVKHRQQVMMYDRHWITPALLAYLQQPEQFFNLPGVRLLKNGRSSTVISINVENHELIIKRYNMKNIFHWLRRCLRTSRAVKNWRFAHLLRLFGIATPKPLAYIEKRFFGLRSESYIIMEKVNGLHLGDYLMLVNNDEAAKAKIASRTKQMLASLSKLKITHGDLKMTNILVENNRPVLIDLDGMQEHKNKHSLIKKTIKERQRFLENWSFDPQLQQLFL